MPGPGSGTPMSRDPRARVLDPGSRVRGSRVSGALHAPLEFIKGRDPGAGILHLESRDPGVPDSGPPTPGNRFYRFFGFFARPPAHPKNLKNLKNLFREGGVIVYLYVGGRCSATVDSSGNIALQLGTPVPVSGIPDPGSL